MRIGRRVVVGGYNGRSPSAHSFGATATASRCRRRRQQAPGGACVPAQRERSPAGEAEEQASRELSNDKGRGAGPKGRGGAAPEQEAP